MQISLTVTLFLLITFISVCNADESSPTTPYNVTLPSALPSGNPINDLIWFTFYPANAPPTHRVPAVVLLHYLGAGKNREMHQYAHYLSLRGIASAVMILPYHTRRCPPGDVPWKHYVGSNVATTVQALGQSASDASTVVTWLGQQPTIDAQRIGVIGMSLGAIVAHLTMGKDERIKAGVALLGGGDLWDMYQRSPAGKLLLRHRTTQLNPEALVRLRQVDPLTYAQRNQPRRVLMIQAARDVFVPPHNAEVLWKALGQPPIQWLDMNHIGAILTSHSTMRTATTYLQLTWNGQGFEASAIPRIKSLTLKVGFLVGLDALVTPAVQWQVYSLGTRQHMALLHADLGWSGRGPFIGLAATVNAYADIGLGRRFNGGKTRPYASFHIVF